MSYSKWGSVSSGKLASACVYLVSLTGHVRFEGNCASAIDGALRPLVMCAFGAAVAHRAHNIRDVVLSPKGHRDAVSLSLSRCADVR